MAQSSGELNVDIKVTGLADLRNQLKAAKDDVIALQSADVIDPAKLAEATKRAGALKDALNDANEQIKVMSGGSDFEKVSGGLSLIGSQLRDMDFEGANNSAKNLTKVMGAMNPATIAKGFGDLAGTVLQLGKAFFTMGLQLLANPIFLIVAIIVAVVAAIILLKDKVKILETAFNMMMLPIKAVIQALKDLGDWLGLTTFAEDEAAQKSIEASEKRIAANEKVTASMSKEYGRQIALAKANGQDTYNLELEQAKQEQIASGKAIDDKRIVVNEKKKLLKNAAGDSKKAAQEELDKAQEALNTEVENYKDSRNKKEVIKATHNKKIIDDDKKASEKSKSEQDKTDKAAEEAAKKHLAIIRGLRDLELSNMEEGLQKDLAMNQEKYKRELEDLKTNKDMSQAERDKYAAQYLIQKDKEDKAALDKDKKRIEDEKKNEKDAQDKRIAEYKAFKKSIADAQQQYNDFMLSKSKDDEKKFNAALDKEYKTQEDNLIAAKNKELSDITLSWIERIAIEAKYGAMLDTLQKQKAADKKEHDDKVKEDEKAATLNRYQEVGAKVVEGLSAINGFLNQADSQRLNDIQKQHSEELALLDKKQQQELSASNLSEAQKKNINDKYAKLKYKADVDAWKKTEEVKKKQFIRDKAMNLVSTAMNIASGIMQIWGHSPDPTGVSQATMTAIISGIGAIQLATIAAQKYQGESGPSAPSIGGGGGGGSVAEPALALYGKKSEANTAKQGQSVEASQQINVTAVVSETEITSTQGKVAKMQKSAEL